MTFPEGQSLGDLINDLFRKGQLEELPIADPNPTPVPEPTANADNEQEDMVADWLDEFVATLYNNGVTELDPRRAATYIRRSFDIWHDGLVDGFRGTAQAVIAGGLTVKDVASHSQARFSKFSREAAILTPGSPEQAEARANSDFWSRMDELIGPASDPDQRF